MSEERKVFIGLPQYGAVDCGHFSSVMRLTEWMFGGQCPFTARIAVNCGDSLICRSRNTISAWFLESDCSHLLMIDSDILFTPGNVEQICSHEEDIVGGLYCKKADGPMPGLVCNTLIELKPKRPDGLQEVKYTGTGFICIKRRVFELMMQHGCCLPYSPDLRPQKTEYDFWSPGVHDERYLSEDWAFCERWRDLFGTVWIDTRVLLQHAGRAVYPLQSQRAALLSRDSTPIKIPIENLEVKP